MQPRLTLFGDPAVSLAGWHQNLTRRAARVATWLTCHPAATSDELLEALFGHVPAAKRTVRHEADIRNGLSELRQALAYLRSSECLCSTADGHSLGGVRSDLADVQNAL